MTGALSERSMRISSTRPCKYIRPMQAAFAGGVLSLGGVFTEAHATESSDELRNLLLQDMQVPHEFPPSGVPENWSWSYGGRVGLGNNPGSFRALIPWGQIYKVRGSHIPEGTQVEIRHMLACVLPKEESPRWRVLYRAEGVTGRAFVEDYKDDQSRETSILQMEGVTRMLFMDGYNLHFWPVGGRIDIDPSNIQGLYVLMQARWVSGAGDASPPPLMFSAGADYWLNKTAEWDHYKTNSDMAIGRFRMLGVDWRTFTASTVGADVLDQYPPDCVYPAEDHGLGTG